MKKVAIIFITIVMTLRSVFAVKSVSFEWAKDKSIFKESSANPYAFYTTAQIMYLKEDELSKYPLRFSYLDNGKIRYADLYPQENEFSHMAVKFKFALNKRVFYTRLEFDNAPVIEFDFNAKAFAVFGFSIKTRWNDMIGFDGSWFLGPELRIAEKYSVRVAWHHLSCHYGDEFLSGFNKVHSVTRTEETGLIDMDGDGTAETTMLGMAEYVRNCLLVGFQYEWNHGFTSYAELDVPLTFKNNFPFFEVGVNSLDFFKELAGKEGVLTPDTEAQIEAEYADLLTRKYICAKVHIGLDWEGKVGPVGLYAGFDVQAYQDNKTNHQVGEYDSSRAWDFDYTAVAGVRLPYGPSTESHALSVEFAYHWGRFLFNNYYYLRGNQAYIGFRID